MDKKSVWARCAVLITGSEDAISRLLSDGIAEDVSISINTSDDHYVPAYCVAEFCKETGREHEIGDTQFAMSDNVTIEINS